MQRFLKVLKRIAICAAAVTVMFILSGRQPVLAKGETGDNTAWLRAKITYEFDRGVTGLSDDIITFSSGKWKKSGGWYYYSDPVLSGQKIRFIDGVRLPSTWTNDLIDKGFKIIITVEAAEASPGETGWGRNNEAVFTKSFELWNNGFQHEEDIYVKEGRITVTINEYQLDGKGNEVRYENNKVVTPGQHISKIVEFEVGGEKGALVRLKPEKPVKTVMASNINVDGKTVDTGTVLTYGITVKNPTPDPRVITITDQVDSRLTVLDTAGGTMVSGAIGGKGGKIEWKAEVPGGGAWTVHFIAQLPEEIGEEDGMTVANTAYANIVGKDLASNTVITSIGKATALQQLVTKVVARATGDASSLWLYIAAFVIVCAACAVTILFFHRKRK